MRSDSTNMISSGSPSDRLGQLMTQLGERFSHRNEARKRRAEMQEKVTLQNQQMEAMRMQRARREAEERERMTVQSVPVQERSQSTVLPRQSVPHRDHLPTEHEGKRRVVETHPQASVAKTRHPLAQSDVNQTTVHDNHLPPKSATVRRSPQYQQQNPTGPTKGTDIYMQLRDRVEQQQMQQPVPAASRAQVHPAHQHYQATVPTLTLPTVQPAQKTTAPAVPPVVVTEPETETGNHPTSDTSFESMADMDGLFTAGGEEVEALFRACDGF